MDFWGNFIYLRDNNVLVRADIDINQGHIFPVVSWSLSPAFEFPMLWVGEENVDDTHISIREKFS
jgi:hypothetical protein